jgi:Rap1a immunity proteins
MLLLGLVYCDHVLTGIFMKMFVVSAMTSVTMATAAAQGSTIAKDVLPYCKLAPKEAAATETSANAYSYCLGAISGIVMGTWRRIRSGDPVYLTGPGCFDVPAQAFIELETLKVIIMYADAHPLELTEPFARVAARALREAWPCRAVL